ncbi:MAG: type IV pilin protein [Pseudomonadota bacterium]|nr:type IV pilin protein [Pseudomonadota bacterium]
MITVAIIGILVAIAYPSYTESVRKGQRAEARTILLEAAQFMQRSYANNDTFAGAVLPASLTRSPQAGTQLYTISIVAGATRTTYTLQAVPSGILASDKCGTLTLNNAGQRGATGAYGAANCWK